jgi:hypothetical protein
MYLKDMSLKESLEYVKSKRSVSEPNSNFQNQLKDFGNSEIFTKLKDDKLY